MRVIVMTMTLAVMGGNRVYIEDGYYYELSKKNNGHDHFPKKKLIKLWLKELGQSDYLVTTDDTKLEGELPSSAQILKGDE